MFECAEGAQRGEGAECMGGSGNGCVCSQGRGLMPSGGEVLEDRKIRWRLNKKRI